MFNLKNQPFDDQTELLRKELLIFDICPNDHGYQIEIGDEHVDVSTISECKSYIEDGIKEIKQHLLEEWNDLSSIAQVILNNSASNEGNIDNLIFLNSVKKSHLLSRVFTDLDKISESIESLFGIDIADVHTRLITKFNDSYLKIKSMHYLVMKELYRLQLIAKWSMTTKQAQSVSGPWANLDLPMKERVWEWGEDEEHFSMREKAKQEQVRYNPEYLKQGFFYVWQDLTRDPYKFEDMKTDSPYKSRHTLTIP